MVNGVSLIVPHRGIAFQDARMPPNGTIYSVINFVSFDHPIPPCVRARPKTFKDHLCCGPHRKFLPKRHAFAARTIGGLPGSSCPLATSLLIDFDGKSVTFWYKEPLTREKNVLHAPALFFSRKWCHISLPRGCKWFARAGLYARCIKGSALEVSAVLLLSQMRHWK